MTDSERQLVDLYLDGVLPESEHALLLQRLETDPEALVYLASQTQLNVDLRRSFKRRKLQQMAVAGAATSMARQTRLPWLSWRPLTAAAAGIVFGMFCTSVVFAYVRPSLGKLFTLLQESFESGPAPEVTGLPTKIGRWSGDFTQFVGEQHGVKPASGERMLRFLRADYEGKVAEPGSYISDLYRLVDVRVYQDELGDGGTIAQLSALFDASSFTDSETYICSAAIYVLDGESVARLGKKHGWFDSKEALAMVRNSRVSLDGDPKTWQSVSAELRLPRDAEFLLLQLSVQHSATLQRRETFDGHYLDDVRLTLGRRAPLQ